MADLREQLERESMRVRLAPGSQARMWERRRRRDRQRRVSALVLGATLTLVIVAIVVQGARLSGDGRTPPSPAPAQPSYDAIAGTYVTNLSTKDPTVERLGLEGRYELRLLQSGVLLLSVPSTFEQAVGSVVFRLSGNVFTTNALTNFLCPGTVGAYRWSLDPQGLTFVPLDEPCELRGALFSTRPWKIAGAG